MYDKVLNTFLNNISSTTSNKCRGVRDGNKYTLSYFM